MLERLTTFKRAWLATHGLASTAFYDEGSPALPAMVRVLAEAGLLHVFVLECGGAVVAVSINFVQAGTMMAFVTTYDPAFERGSPGMVLMMDYIMWSIDRGLHTVDFLCGDEGFKGRFGTQSLTLASMIGRAHAPGLRGRSSADRAQHALAPPLRSDGAARRCGAHRAGPGLGLPGGRITRRTGAPGQAAHCAPGPPERLQRPCQGGESPRRGAPGARWPRAAAAAPGP